MRNHQRHCMVVHNSYPFAETRVQREANALINAGIEVDVICLHQGSEPGNETIDGVHIYRLPIQRKKGISAAAQLVEYLIFFIQAFFKLTSLHFSQRYHTIQVHNLPDFLVFVAIIPKLTGSRVILDLHDLMPEFYRSRFGGSTGSWFLKLIRYQERLSCRFADHVITVTEPWRQTLIERGVPPAKCTVVMNLADEKFRPPMEMQNTSKTKNGQFCILYHGTLSRRYGLDLLLKALAQVCQTEPGVHLTVHGRGEYLLTLQQLSTELGLNEQVRFNDKFLSIEQLSMLITAADLGVVPYRRDVFTDGILPTKLMEYAALGLPAIVARTPGIAAYFDETMVEYFPAEDVGALAKCIQALFLNRSRLDELSHNIRKFNDLYNWSSHQRIYVDLVRKLTLPDF